jgi:hypothetical protein
MEVESQMKIVPDYNFNVDGNEETILKSLIKKAEYVVNC